MVSQEFGKFGDRLAWLGTLLGRYCGDSVSLRRRLVGLELNRLEVLDCGCGLNNTVVSRQVLRLPFRKLVSVDGFAPVLEFAAKRRAFALRRELLCLGLTDLAAHFGHRKTFDVALCLDALEHLPKEQALPFLSGLEELVSRRIILWLPLGEYRVDADPHGRNNDLEFHRSFWFAEEIAALGYSVEVLRRFHQARFDALWAVKEMAG